MIVTVPDVTAVTSPPEVTEAPTERACQVAVAKFSYALLTRY
jgi:hypothetical protein